MSHFRTTLKGLNVGRQTVPVSQIRRKLTAEQREWIINQLRAGKSNSQVARLFFRQFNQDLSASGVRTYRNRLDES